MAPAAQTQIIEVELEDVVPLDDVRILRLDHVDELDQQALLGGVGLLLQDEQALARAELQPDGQHAVAGIAGVAEATAGGMPGFDVELAAPQLRKGHLAKHPPPPLQQILVLQRADPVDHGAVGRLLHELLKRGVGSAHGPASGRRPRLSSASTSTPATPLDHGRVPQPGEGPEGIRLLPRGRRRPRRPKGAPGPRRRPRGRRVRQPGMCLVGSVMRGDADCRSAFTQ